MQLTLPKFHDRPSIVIGIICGLFLFGNGIYSIFLSVNLVGSVLQTLVGLGLAIHMLDTLIYYKKHRIVRIVKTDTHRQIHKEAEIVKPNKLACLGNALRVVWQQKPFKVWVAICIIGIALGLYAGIGMTNLIVLVAIACLGWALETANTSIEMLVDLVNPQYSDKVKVVKDLYGAVPAFVYSAYVVSWLILVAPSLYLKVVG